ncbi:MAG: site-specific DNA-methyltransferase [Clostridia bacterium]|nr:site-specific DNA-methyltransferase [Clostridia bacterium]
MNNKIFIGDNLTTMKTPYFNQLKSKIDFIYIDPPYNTTNSKFSYNDKNDKWSDDIYERLKCAYELLSDEGCIFISIDDNELSNLLYLGYKIFKKDNYVGLFITKQAQRSNAKHINTIHEYVVCFAKNKKKLPKFYINRLENPTESEPIKAIINKIKRTYKISPQAAYDELKKSIDKYVKDTGATWIRNYSNIDENGEIFFAKDLSTPGKPSRLDIEEINLHLEPLKTRGWSSKEKILSLYNENRLCFKNGRPYCIEYLYEATDNVSSILDFYSRQGTNDLKKMGLDGLFDTPKPVELIKFLIRCSQHKSTTILDFYAGSGTTAQAVYEINEEDKMEHKYILIQIDEKINEKNDAYNLMKERGYNNPTVDQAMILRINTFLEINNKKIDYDVEVLNNE